MNKSVSGAFIDAAANFLVRCLIILFIAALPGSIAYSILGVSTYFIDRDPYFNSGYWTYSKFRDFGLLFTHPLMVIQKWLECLGVFAGLVILALIAFYLVDAIPLAAEKSCLAFLLDTKETRLVDFNSSGELFHLYDQSGYKLRVLRVGECTETNNKLYPGELVQVPLSVDSATEALAWANEKRTDC